jgi:hypothetical protein
VKPNYEQMLNEVQTAISKMVRVLDDLKSGKAKLPDDMTLYEYVAKRCDLTPHGVESLLAMANELPGEHIVTWKGDGQIQYEVCKTLAVTEFRADVFRMSGAVEVEVLSRVEFLKRVSARRFKIGDKVRVTSAAGNRPVAVAVCKTGEVGSVLETYPDGRYSVRFASLRGRVLLHDSQLEPVSQ